MRVEIGGRLRDLRKGKSEFTQEQAADFFGISFSRLKSWERGETYPSPDKVLDMAKYYGVTVGYIYAGEDCSGNVIKGEPLDVPDDIGALTQREAQRVVRKIGLIKSLDNSCYEDLIDQIDDLVVFVNVKQKEGK